MLRKNKRPDPAERADRARVRSIADQTPQRVQKVQQLRAAGAPMPEPVVKLLDELQALRPRREEASVNASIRAKAVATARSKLLQAQADAERAGQRETPPSVTSAERALEEAEAKQVEVKSRSEALAIATEQVEDELPALINEQATKFLAISARELSRADEEVRTHEEAAQQARKRAYALQGATNLYRDAASSAGINASSHKYDPARLQRAAESRGIVRAV